MKLSFSTFDQIHGSVRRPGFDARALQTGQVHLGVGAFHRAHVAMFNDDAIESGGGAWGIIGVSMRKPDVADALNIQDGLYTVETLDAVSTYRVAGSVRAALTLPLQPAAVISALASPAHHIATLTVTEKGYCLKGDTLDFDHPDVVQDLADPLRPTSAIGVLVAGLAARRTAHGEAMTIVSCDNLMDNGPRLRGAVLALADRRDAALARWIADEIAFPDTMVDCIVPASTPESRTRAEAALGLTDVASVQREPFAEWVIEDRFSGPRPAWDKVGATLSRDVAGARRLKLHVLNAAHSTLAYLGLERGCTYVREAAADPQLAHFVDAMMTDEIAPALPALPVADYWAKTKARFANPAIDHRLDQIAQDGAFKLTQRLYPLMLDNRRKALPFARMAEVARAYLRHAPPRDAAALQALFPAALWADPVLRDLIVGTGA